MGRVAHLLELGRDHVHAAADVVGPFEDVVRLPARHQRRSGGSAPVTACCMLVIHLVKIDAMHQRKV